MGDLMDIAQQLEPGLAEPGRPEGVEQRLVPYVAHPSIPAASVLVLAPHPDDEVFGCGGAILSHRARGVPVRVAIATDGALGLDGEARARHARLRQGESRAAAAVLGYG